MTRLRLWTKTLFGTWLNSVITAAMLAFFWWLLPLIWRWAVVSATWLADNRNGCTEGGACWAFVRAKFRMFLYGNYPASEEWRVQLALCILLGCLLGCVATNRHKGAMLVALGLSLPLNAIILAGGFAGLPFVATSDWGGLMLNIVLAFVAIFCSIPLGIVLAFARRSGSLWISRAATVFIEFWRAVPLLAVLFVGVVMLPLFLPAGFSFDNLGRALIVLVLFTSAYMAEVFRGALETIPHGQEEAAAAVGMNRWLTAVLILLPQAMRFAVPGIVNVAIDFFKDTSLVSIVGLFDLAGVTTQSIKDPAWLGLTNEAYAFAAGLFFICCLLIAFVGQFIEWRLNRPWRSR